MAARRRKKGNEPMVFSAMNYKILALSVMLIVIGFTIMRLENEVYGFISLYVAPIIIMAGYATVVVAILKRPHRPDKEKSASTS